MTWRVPPFDRALDELIAYARKTYAPLGMLVSGSIVRGEAGPTSDLDVFVVHDQPWRVREQKRFAGVPTELFINPAAQVRRYFEHEHAEARPCTAHMFATGFVIDPVHPVVEELVREARAWLMRPLEPTELQLVQRRYGAVDLLDDARDIVDVDPAAAALVLAEAVQAIVAYAFWRRALPQPRRKQALAALAAIDSEAAALVRAWSSSQGRETLAITEALASHVLGVDRFFEWASPQEQVPT